MFRLTSEIGIEEVKKDSLLPADHVKIWAGSWGEHYARLSGAFGGIGAIAGSGDFLRTWLIVYGPDGQEQSKPYGVYSFDISSGLTPDTKPTYTQKPNTSSTNFTANVGGILPFSYVNGNPEEGYWIGKLSGTWDTAASPVDTPAGTIKSDMSGRYLTSNQWGLMLGGFYGIYNGSASGTWGGNAVGTFEGASLAMSADFSGRVQATVPGKITSRLYERPCYEAYSQHFNTPEYELIYFVPQNGADPKGRMMAFESVEWIIGAHR